LLNRGPCPIRKRVELPEVDRMGFVVEAIQIAHPKIASDDGDIQVARERLDF
jgi:hypothetical protein